MFSFFLWICQPCFFLFIFGPVVYKSLHCHEWHSTWYHLWFSLCKMVNQDKYKVIWLIFKVPYKNQGYIWYLSAHFCEVQQAFPFWSFFPLFLFHRLHDMSIFFSCPFIWLNSPIYIRLLLSCGPFVFSFPPQFWQSWCHTFYHFLFFLTLSLSKICQPSGTNPKFSRFFLSRIFCCSSTSSKLKLKWQKFLSMLLFSFDDSIQNFEFTIPTAPLPIRVFLILLFPFRFSSEFCSFLLFFISNFARASTLLHYHHHHCPFPFQFSQLHPKNGRESGGIFLLICIKFLMSHL